MIKKKKKRMNDTEQNYAERAVHGSDPVMEVFAVLSLFIVILVVPLIEALTPMTFEALVKITPSTKSPREREISVAYKQN